MNLRLGDVVNAVVLVDDPAGGTVRVNPLALSGGRIQVTSSPPGISCGNLLLESDNCTWRFPEGTTVTLTSAPFADYLFIGWTGACSGTGPCTITTTAGSSATVGARVIALPSISARVTSTPASSQAGTVTFSAGGTSNASCTSFCTWPAPFGTTVTLTAAPQAGYLFLGWNPTNSAGRCTGTNPVCTIATPPFVFPGTLFATTEIANFGPAPSTPTALTVSLAGTGTGSVVSSPAGITCPSSCTANFSGSSLVTLTASPSAGSTFAGWSGGGCSGTAACTVTMDGAKTVQATFLAPITNYAMSVVVAGPGSVVSSPAGISCPGACTASFAAGTVVTLTATPGTNGTFTGWSGDCAGTGATCQITVGQPRNVAASFTTTATPSYSLAVDGAGTGAGTVTSAPAGVTCAITAGAGGCGGTFAAGTTVTLTAAAASGSTFGGWGGDCGGAASTCVLTMNAARSVVASFGSTTSTSFVLTTSVRGAGTVTVAPGGVACSATCATSRPAGSLVTLTAVPAAGSTFGGWSGACSGSATCVVTVDAAKTVTATFVTPTPATLTVATAGTGAGRVTSSPAGIDCAGSAGASSCAFSYAPLTLVTLTATPSAGSTFDGWSGACVGASTVCQVQMTQTATVTAAFSRAVVSLAVAGAGTGSGRVSSAPTGIDCLVVGGAGGGAGCATTFSSNTVVVLTAAPSGGSLFGGWSGACSGTSPTCQVTVDQARTATATFDAPSTLAVSSGGSAGKGRVTSAAAALDCGLGTTSSGSCAAVVAMGTTVSLSATPEPGSVFLGWGGACSGAGMTATCSIRLTGAAEQVTATFATQPQPDAAVTDLFDGRTLNATDRATLDRLGNGDGVYNLGDVLALLDRTGRTLSGATMARLLSLPADYGRTIDGGATRPEPRQRP